VRLRCSVGVAVRPANNQGREQQLRGLDAALYALEAPDLRDGSALAGAADPGFQISTMRVVDARAPLDPTAADAPAVGLTLSAEGWFWPIGVAGEAGVAIGEIRVREALLPVEIAPARPDLVAGGPPVELRLRVVAAGTLRLDGAATTLLPFGALALALAGPGGRPGAGTLAGGADGTAGVRLAPLVDSAATITYTPPAEAATDELVVALDDGAGGQGDVVGRFPLKVREA
jgi:hypothetical protein